MFILSQKPASEVHKHFNFGLTLVHKRIFCGSHVEPFSTRILGSMGKVTKWDTEKEIKEEGKIYNVTRNYNKTKLFYIYIMY